jgi:thioredoxin-related protein
LAAVAATAAEARIRMKKWMSNRRWLWLAAWMSMMVMACQGPAGAQDDGIPWKSYDEALREAKEAGRPVYLYFFMDNCGYCRKMESQTLAEKKIAGYLRDTFVSVRINGVRKPHLSKQYMVRGFPTSSFLTSEGEAIWSIPGYVGPEYFGRMLKYIGEGHFKSQSLRDYLRGS